MRIQSTLTPKAYRTAMKERMGSRFALFSERFTGIFIGRLFYVTHHAGYQWNRRITCQMNSAWGFIKKSDTGCEIHYHTFKSWMCPHMMLLYILLNILYPLANGFDFDSWRKVPGIIIFLIICVLVLFPIIYTGLESITDESENGEKYLLGLLYDPTDYLAYIKKANRKP